MELLSTTDVNIQELKEKKIHRRERKDRWGNEENHFVILGVNHYIPFTLFHLIVHCLLALKIDGIVLLPLIW